MKAQGIPMGIPQEIRDTMPGRSQQSQFTETKENHNEPMHGNKENTKEVPVSRKQPGHTSCPRNNQGKLRTAVNYIWEWKSHLFQLRCDFLPCFSISLFPLARRFGSKSHRNKLHFVSGGCTLVSTQSPIVTLEQILKACPSHNQSTREQIQYPSNNTQYFKGLWLALLLLPVYTRKSCPHSSICWTTFCQTEAKWKLQVEQIQNDAPQTTLEHVRKNWSP